MPEHVHALLTPARGQTIERCVQCIKGGFSHAVRGQFSGEVWQAGFHEHRVRTYHDFCNQLAYIAKNPEKRKLENYLYSHTQYPQKVDPIPQSLSLISGLQVRDDNL